MADRIMEAIVSIGLWALGIIAALGLIGCFVRAWIETATP